MSNHSFSKSVVGFVIFLCVLFSVSIYGQNIQTSGCGDQDYDAQIAEATKGIEFSIYNIQAYLKRADAYIGKGKYEEALKDIQKALAINPRESKAYYYRGKIYADWANYDKAIEEFSKAIEFNSEDSEAFYGRGRSYDFKKQFDLALEDVNRAIAINPNYIVAYYAQGAIYSKKGDYKEAIKSWNKANGLITIEINLAPKDICSYDNYLQRGIINAGSGNFRQALADYDKSIELKKDNSQTYYYRAELYLRQKQYKLAIEDLTKAISLDPQFAESYKDRAIAFEKIGEKEKAEADHNKYQELSEK